MHTMWPAVIVIGCWLMPAAGSPQTGQPERPVPEVVAELGAATVSIAAGASRSHGFFVAPGLVVTTATSLGGRAVVQLVAGSGRSGLGQVIARDTEANLALLRVHADLTPRAVFDVARRAVGRLPASAFLIRGRDVVDQGVDRVELGRSREVGGVSVVDVTPVPPADAVGAPCVDVDGRLLGMVTSGDSNRPAGQVALMTDRIGALLAEARRAMEAAEAAAVSVEPAAPRVAPRDRGRPPSRAPEEPSVESDTERARREGADAFERVAGTLARQRENVTELQARYDVECVGTYVPLVTIPGVGWPYPVDYVIEKSELPECRALQERADGRFEALRRALADAEEQARRAGVYPGTLRDIKRAYGLDGIR